MDNLAKFKQLEHSKCQEFLAQVIANLPLSEFRILLSGQEDDTAGICLSNRDHWNVMMANFSVDMLVAIGIAVCF